MIARHFQDKRFVSKYLALAVNLAVEKKIAPQRVILSLPRVIKKWYCPLILYHPAKPPAMKRLPFVAILTLLLISSLLPAQDPAQLLRDARAEMAKEFYARDYDRAVELLETGLQQRPQDPELLYFLGYALSRRDAPDARANLALTRGGIARASSCFERVIQISPRYSGTNLALDPYSKIGSLWGALATAYGYAGKPDSLRWALEEGRRRGGFLPPLLELGRNLLQSCAAQAILFSSGDNLTYPLLYLQAVEGVRTDVQLIDISLLNTLWYPEWLDSVAVNPILREELQLSAIPDLVEGPVGPVVVGLQHPNCPNRDAFSWELPPRPDNAYLVRSEYVLLQTILLNGFSREVYFTAGFPDTDLLGLEPFLENGILVRRLNPCADLNLRPALDYTRRYSFASLNDAETKVANSPDLQLMLGFYANGLALAAQQAAERGDKAQAQAALEALDQFLPALLRQTMSGGLQDFVQQLRTIIGKME